MAVKRLAYIQDQVPEPDAIFKGAAMLGVGTNSLAEQALAEELAACGVECHTDNALPLGEFDAFLFRDMPARNHPAYVYARKHGKPMMLYVWENHFINRGNRDYGRIRDFVKVFTYSDEFVARNPGKAIKVNYANPLEPPPAALVPFGKRRFACMISSLVRKIRPHLCSYLRLQTIGFYERNHPQDFELYGSKRWENGTFLGAERPTLGKWLTVSHLYRLMPSVAHPCWRGPCASKTEVLRNCRFGYCYENTTEIPGYITEKIFDVLSGGAVPVYLAHPSATKHIPPETFVDRAAFKDDAELYAYLKAMDEKTFDAYLEAGRAFLASEAARAFSAKAYADAVAPEVLEVMGLRKDGAIS